MNENFFPPQTSAEKVFLYVFLLLIAVLNDFRIAHYWSSADDGNIGVAVWGGVGLDIDDNSISRRPFPLTYLNFNFWPAQTPGGNVFPISNSKREREQQHNEWNSEIINFRFVSIAKSLLSRNVDIFHCRN